MDEDQQSSTSHDSHPRSDRSSAAPDDMDKYGAPATQNGDGDAMDEDQQSSSSDISQPESGDFNSVPEEIDEDEIPATDYDRDDLDLDDAINEVCRWDSYAYLTIVENLHIIATSDPRESERRAAWTLAHRLYNGAMVTWHGRTSWADKCGLCETRRALRKLWVYRMKEPPTPDPLPKELLRFAGDADMEALRTTYHYPVLDPSVRYMRSKMSNFNFPPPNKGLPRNTSGVHGGPLAANIGWTVHYPHPNGTPPAEGEEYREGLSPDEGDDSDPIQLEYRAGEQPDWSCP